MKLTDFGLSKIGLVNCKFLLDSGLRYILGECLALLASGSDPTV